jgi:hypothetical protein
VKTAQNDRCPQNQKQASDLGRHGGFYPICTALESSTLKTNGVYHEPPEKATEKYKK